MQCQPFVVAAGVLLPVIASAASAEGPYPRSTHELSIGATRQAAESVAQASVRELPAVAIDLNDLNVGGDYDSWFAEYSWRFGRRWMLDAFAYRYQDSGRAISSEDFNYDRTVFSAGSVVDSTLEINTYSVHVLYAAYQGSRGEVLVGAGIHAMELSAAFKGLVTLGEEVATFATSSDEFFAPLPNLRARGAIAFNDRLGADLTAGWLSADIDDFEGSFTYAHARLRCRLGERSSVSLGYQLTTVDVSRNGGLGDEEKPLDGVAVSIASTCSPAPIRSLLPRRRDLFRLATVGFA